MHMLLKFSWLKITLCMALFALQAQLAYSQNLNTSAAHVKINVVDVNWLLAENASSVLLQTIERTALTEQGAQATTKYAQQYDKKRQKLEVIEAYTLKADGRKIAVTKEGMQIQSGVTAVGTGASWPDAEIMQITFPDVQKGDKTGWLIKLTTLAPVLPNWASLQDYLLPSVTIEKYSAKIEAPQSLNLQVFTAGVSVSSSQAGKNQIWEISGNSDARVIDNNIANSIVSFPRIFVSTFKTHMQLGDAYAAQSNAKAVVTDEIKTLALKITGDKKTDLDKATALHDWVRKNIRYVAVYLGTGGWVPHDIEWILKNRYGDCKDHVLLLQTLLKAVGIEAVPVMINTTAEYELAELPIGFNHCIIYVPSLNLFADPTDNRIPFGALPWVDAGKLAVVALAGGSTLMRTPAFTVANNRISVKTQLMVSRSGKATGSIEINSSGYAATVLQNQLEQIPGGMGGVAVRKILESSNLRGRGFTQYPAVQRDTQSQNFKINDLEMDNLLNDASAGSINPHPALNLPLYALNQMGDYSAEKRDYAFSCSPIHVREEFEISFAPEFQLIRSPANIKESHPDGIMFEANYIKEGNSIKGWRELTLSHPRQVCSASEYAARRPVMNRIAQHLRSGILFQQ